MKLYKYHCRGINKPMFHYFDNFGKAVAAVKDLMTEMGTDKGWVIDDDGTTWVVFKAFIGVDAAGEDEYKLFIYNK